MSGEMKNTVKHQLYEMGKGWLEWATGPMKGSKFDKGMVTPEEFIIAGDALVSKCPAWTWAPAPSGKRVEYLPKQKQYIIIKRVPCLTRARAEGVITETSLDVDGEDWTLPEALAPPKAAVVDVGDAEDVDGSAPTGPADIDDIDDIDDLDEAPKKKPVEAPAAAVAADEVEDPTAPPPLPTAAAGGDEVAAHFRPRTYDVSITYDQTYATPRLWLFGYRDDGQPLTEAETCEDVWGDYTGDTVTLLPHPFLGTPNVSIHPCRHAESMQRMLNELNENIAERTAGAAKPAATADAPAAAAADAKPADAKAEDAGPTGLTVEAYLFVFLKFMTCVVPTISYDNTRDLDF